MAKQNLADAFGSEVIACCGYAMTRATAYRLNFEYFDNTAECADYVAFGPFAKVIDAEPSTFAEMVAEFDRIDPSAASEAFNVKRVAA
jgi:hypothetical protein